VIFQNRYELSDFASREISGDRLRPCTKEPAGNANQSFQDPHSTDLFCLIKSSDAGVLKSNAR
jgi:hypothetical protein